MGSFERDFQQSKREDKNISKNSDRNNKQNDIVYFTDLFTMYLNKQESSDNNSNLVSYDDLLERMDKVLNLQKIANQVKTRKTF